MGASNPESRVAACLAGGLLGLTVAGSAQAGGHVPGLPYRPDAHTQAAQDSANAHFEAQAQKALQLDQTIWNDHFEDGKDELHPSGLDLLDRLARRPQPVLTLYLQTAHDIRFQPSKPAAYTQERTELNAKRIQAITSYLAATRPDVAVVVRVNDPSEGGMAATEAVIGIRDMQRGPRGLLPAELVGGLSITSRGLVSGPPPGSSVGSTSSTSGEGSPSAFGADAPGSSGGPSSSGP